MGGQRAHKFYASVLAHAQLLETGPLFQPTCESLSRDAPEINRHAVFFPVTDRSAPSCGFSLGCWWSEEGSLDFKNRSTAVFWGVCREDS